MDVLNEDKKQTRKEEVEKRRLKILSAALDIFIQKGYVATTINNIASAVNMNSESVIHYFESKEKIYEELVRIARKGLTPSIVTKAKNDEIEPLQFFKTIAEEVFKYMKKYPFFSKLFLFMLHVYSNDAASDAIKKMLHEEAEWHLVLIEKLKQGQLNGTIKEGDPIILMNTFFGAINGVCLQTAVANIPLPDSKWLVDIIKK